MIIQDNALYQAILNRRSTRQYRQEPLPPETLERVDEILAAIEPLHTGREMHIIRLDDVDRADRVIAQGAYGRFIVSPHILLPYLEGNDAALIEVGYQSEQIAIRLWQEGISTCFVGAAGREGRLLDHFHLPAGAKTAAAIMYGIPTDNPKRSLATYFRSPDRKRKRLGLKDLFLGDERPPQEMAPLVEAGRWAPSATNAQPWRFRWHEGRLQVYLTHRTYPAVLSESSQKTYMWHDGGVVMANISMALKASGEKGTWDTGGGSDEGSPPKTLQGYLLLASLTIG